MIGNRRTLEHNRTWEELIDHCEKNGGYYKIRDDFQDFKGKENIRAVIEKKR